MFSRVIKSRSQAGYKSLSGPGSSLLSTRKIRQQMPLLIQDLEVRSVLDVGCGEFNWMKRVKLGVDIGKRPGREFQDHSGQLR